MVILFAGLKLLQYYIQPGGNFFARQFANQNNKVFYFSDPLSILHILRDGCGEENRIRFSIFKNPGTVYEKKISCFNPIQLFPNYGKFPFSSPLALSLSQKTCYRKPNVYLKREGIERVDILWIENIYYSFLMDLIPHKVCVYRISDYIFDYNRYGKAHYKTDKIILDKAHIVFCVTNKILNYARSLRPKKPTILLPNGVDYDFFEKDSRLEPTFYQTIPRPRIVFMGTFNKLFHPQLVFDLCRKLPNISFIIIGPKIWWLNIPKLPNLYYLGPIPYQDLPPYLKHADLGLIPLSRTRKQAVTLPLKAYQFMAAGLPYVCSYFDQTDLNEFQPPGFYPESEEEIPQAILNALSIEEGARDKLKEYAKNNSWTKHFKNAMEHIKGLDLL